jgi:hypothetical protein
VHARVRAKEGALGLWGDCVWYSEEQLLWVCVHH